jgi:hypothetical protein
MKKLIIGNIVVCAVTLCISQVTHAQGTTYFSGLSGVVTGTENIASDNWVAIGFETG